MKRLLAVLLGSLAAAAAGGAPKAGSALECGIAADMAVVARSLAEEQVQRRTSQKFAEELFSACIKSGGNMDTVLGQRL